MSASFQNKKILSNNMSECRICLGRAKNFREYFCYSLPEKSLARKTPRTILTRRGLSNSRIRRYGYPSYNMITVIGNDFPLYEVWGCPKRICALIISIILHLYI